MLDGLEAREGLVAAGYYGYLQGVDNEMADMFVPADVKPRLAKAGGWEIFWRSDLLKAAPLWFEYTKRVRQDPRAHWPFKGTGDVYITKQSPRPWICEMYGYVFGTAMAGLEHNVEHSCQLYAGMAPWDADSFDPFLLHYGIRIDVEDWSWDKHVEMSSVTSNGEHDKLDCEKPFTPFPTVPKDLLADEDGAGDDAAATYSLGSRAAETRRRALVQELMLALNRGVHAARLRRCGEPWPEGVETLGLDVVDRGNDAKSGGAEEKEGDVDDVAASSPSPPIEPRASPSLSPPPPIEPQASPSLSPPPTTSLASDAAVERAEAARGVNSGRDGAGVGVMWALSVVMWGGALAAFCGATTTFRRRGVRRLRRGGVAGKRLNV